MFNFLWGIYMVAATIALGEILSYAIRRTIRKRY